MHCETQDKRDRRRQVPAAVYEGEALYPPEEGIFCLAALSRGEGTLITGETSIPVCAPAFLCLSGAKKYRLVYSEKFWLHAIYFRPAFVYPGAGLEGMPGGEFHVPDEMLSMFGLTSFEGHYSSHGTVLKPAPCLLKAAAQKITLCAEQLRYPFDGDWSGRTRAYLLELLEYTELLAQNFGLSPAAKGGHPSSLDLRLPEILCYIHSHLEEPLSLQTVSSQFGTNRTDLEKIFKNRLDTTFYRYISGQRIQRALKALRFTSLPLAEIAGQSGFSTTQNFCKFFKGRMNISPIKYRQMHLEQRKAVLAETKKGIAL